MTSLSSLTITQPNQPPERWEELAGSCGSPIEIDLVCELFHLWTLDEQWGPFVITPGSHRLPKMGYSIAPQYPVGPYKADFAITLLRNEKDPGGAGIYTLDTLPHTFEARLVVECDGHEWHERTKEQAAKDKKRDRYFLTHGWPVIRFTGSEIKADPADCALQVSQTLAALLEQQAHDTKDLRELAKQARALASPPRYTRKDPA